MKKFLPCLSLATIRTIQNNWTKNNKLETELKIVNSEVQNSKNQEVQEKTMVQWPGNYNDASNTRNPIFRIFSCMLLKIQYY